MFPSLSYCVPFNKLSSFHSPSNFTPSEKVYHNLRLAGNDHFAIKKISGHKTDSAFQRYNLVTEAEMKGEPSFSNSRISKLTKLNLGKIWMEKREQARKRLQEILKKQKQSRNQ